MLGRGHRPSPRLRRTNRSRLQFERDSVTRDAIPPEPLPRVAVSVQALLSHAPWLVNSLVHEIFPATQHERVPVFAECIERLLHAHRSDIEYGFHVSPA